MGSFIDTQPSSQLNMTDTCNPPLSSVDIVDDNTRYMYYVIMFYIPVPVDVLNIKPKISQVVTSYSKWEVIGVHLGVEEETLRGLKISNDDNHTKLCRVIHKWIEMDGEVTPVTWNTIFNVLKFIKTILNSIQTILRILNIENISVQKFYEYLSGTVT